MDSFFLLFFLLYVVSFCIVFHFVELVPLDRHNKKLKTLVLFLKFMIASAPILNIGMAIYILIDLFYDTFNI